MAVGGHLEKMDMTL